MDVGRVQNNVAYRNLTVSGSNFFAAHLYKELRETYQIAGNKDRSILLLAAIQNQCRCHKGVMDPLADTHIHLAGNAFGCGEETRIPYLPVQMISSIKTPRVSALMPSKSVAVSLMNGVPGAIVKSAENTGLSRVPLTHFGNFPP